MHIHPILNGDTIERSLGPRRYDQIIPGIQRAAGHRQLTAVIEIQLFHVVYIGILQQQFAAVADMNFIGGARTREHIRRHLILGGQRAVHIQRAPVLQLQACARLHPRCLAAGYGDAVAFQDSIAAGQSGGQG